MPDLSSVGGSSSSSLEGVTASTAGVVIEGGTADDGIPDDGRASGSMLEGEVVSGFRSEDGVPALPLERGIASVGVRSPGFTAGLGCLGMMTSGVSKLPSSSTCVRGNFKGGGDFNNDELSLVSTSLERLGFDRLGLFDSPFPVRALSGAKFKPLEPVGPGRILSDGERS